MKRKRELFTAVSCLALTAVMFCDIGMAQSPQAGKHVSQAAKPKVNPKVNQAKPASQKGSPQRISSAAVPARIAFTHDGQLWLLDASQPNAIPKQVTKQGSVEIIGWSYNGEWLLYLQHSTKETYQSPPFLWVVKADGTGAFQVDATPNVVRPKWSPTDTTIAYLRPDGQKEYRLSLVLANIENGKAKITSPKLEGKPDDVAWMPDGGTLLVSTGAQQNQPIRMLKVERNGLIKQTYQIGDNPNVEEGIYFSHADGLTISSNGRYVAFFVSTNSASISADGVSLHLLDLLQPANSKEIGGSLAYPEWLAWSPDSLRLAFIEGGGREATDNEQLAIVEMNAPGTTIHASQKDFVNSLPIWASANGQTLYYTHGKANVAWMGNYDPSKVFVPGQRIWERLPDGKQRPVTTGSEKTFDTYPQVSRDGKTLLFVRLDGAEHGSLYVKAPGAKQETELLRHITGDAGFYGNYLPEWISVYWQK